MCGVAHVWERGGGRGGCRVDPIGPRVRLRCNPRVHSTERVSNRALWPPHSRLRLFGLLGFGKVNYGLGLPLNSHSDTMGAAHTQGCVISNVSAGGGLSNSSPKV